MINSGTVLLGTWEKNVIGTRFPPKKNIFSLPATVIYYDSWDLKKINLTGPSPK